MPGAPHITDVLVRIASSGAIGIGIAAALLIAVQMLAPPAQRRKLRLPFVLLCFHVAALLARMPLAPTSALNRTLSVVSLFFLLAALGRAAFLLVVDLILGVRLGRPLPRIIRDIIQGLVYAGVVLITLRAAGVEPGSLLTTSALLTAVIGLSLQETLGNLFAGLAIQAQRPFEVGDWIQIEPDPRLIGQIIEINWRATKVLTNDQVELTIPNGTLAKSTIRNFTKPTVTARRTIEVPGPYEAPPPVVEQALLSAAASVPGVLLAPPPFVLTARFDDRGITYQLCFFIDDFARRDRVDSAVRQRIWFAFHRAGIAIPFPSHTVRMAEVSPESRERSEADERQRRLQSLRVVDFLAALPPPLLDRLATLSKTCLYMVGEVVIRQGAAGHELFIVQSGEVSVIVGREGGSTAEVARLGPGKFFGEMSLMTGEPRSATIQAVSDCELVKVDKAAFQEILAAAPGIAEKITEVLVARQSALDENVSVRRARAGAEEAKTTALLGKIRQFFSL
ncbi:cyclic nucleotide-binding domain-containing protein [Sorangium sp. So ce1099]|uniref:cyclic nucleotide-binding domain-containing protein n=1 Tax=Sorangium sp. So ce1099 TaxID=3133331 RepID=UPI003F5FD113